MDRFVDRTAELDALEREYRRGTSSFVVVYGRRRVGKTALITKFIRDKRALYFLATEEPERQNLKSFQAMVGDFIGSNLLRSAHLERWEDVFGELARFCKEQSERIVLVIDEFQYLGASNPAYPSVFQRIWDMELSSCNIMLIVCGSLISLMRDQVLSERSPLYGRRTAQLHMRQIPFTHYGAFFPNRTLKEQVERYAVTGGVPKYIELFEDDDDLFQAITRNVLTRSGFLYEEPQYLLSQEVHDIGTYFALVRAIAAGAHKPSEIARDFGMKQTSISKYLRTLMDLDVIARKVPATEKNPDKSKRGLYTIKDQFLAFWFKFVLPNVSYLESGRSEAVEQKIRAHFIDGHVAFVYEEVCRQRLWDLCDAGRVPFIPERVGAWWSGSDEIDIAGVHERERLALWGECKYWKDPVGINVLSALERKAERVPWYHGERKDTFVLFSISGFTDALQALAEARDDVLLFDDSCPVEPRQS